MFATWRLIPEGPVGSPAPSMFDGLDAVLSFGHMTFDAELVRRTPRLTHVARSGAGYDGTDPVGLAAEGVIVTTRPPPPVTLVPSPD